MPLASGCGLFPSRLASVPRVELVSTSRRSATCLPRRLTTPLVPRPSRHHAFLHPRPLPSSPNSLHQLSPPSLSSSSISPAHPGISPYLLPHPLHPCFLTAAFHHRRCHMDGFLLPSLSVLLIKVIQAISYSRHTEATYIILADKSC